MTLSWILSYATPTSLKVASSVAPTGYIRNVLVIKKEEASTMTLLTAKNGNKAVDGLFDAGLSKVYYKTQEDLDLSSLDLAGVVFSIIADGFNESELEARVLGSFNGVFVFESNSLNPSVVYNTWEINSNNLDGSTAGFTLGLLLAGANFRNLQYTSTNKNVSFTDDKGTAEQIYEAYGTIWGKDDFQGIRLVSAFINGQGVSKPYILEEIKVLTQASNLKMLSNELSWTKLDAQNVKAVNTSFINENYVKTGLVSSFDYSVVLGSSSREFNSTLDVVVPMPVFKIKMEVTA